MRAIVRGVRGLREDWIAEVVQATGADVVYDSTQNAFDTFLSALEAQGMEGAWHLEDDVIPTSGWREKAAAAVTRCGEGVIQGYSDRKKDETVGSRWEPGGNFRMNQCFWVPGILAQDMRDFCSRWPQRRGNPGWYDVAMADFMSTRRLRYWIVVPSLVQHRQAKSLISHHHHSNRQSRTFVP